MEQRYMVSLIFAGSREVLVHIQGFLRASNLGYAETNESLEAEELERGVISIDSAAPETSSVEEHFLDLEKTINLPEFFNFVKSFRREIYACLRIGVLYYTVDCTVNLSSELLKHLGLYGISLEMSSYPCEEKTATPELGFQQSTDDARGRP